LSKIKPILFYKCLFLLFISCSMSAQEFKKALFVNQTDTLPYNILFPLTNSELTEDTTDKIKKSGRISFNSIFHGSGERGKDNEKQIIHIKKLFTDSAIMQKYPAFIVATNVLLASVGLNPTGLFLNI